jgi:drug/metabolite transporter (DMT)-like permease
MSAPANYVPAACSLTAMAVWGVSDFVGGLGARRANAFLFTSIVHAGGMAVMGTLALTLHDALPERNSVLWALAAGSIGGISLACFYRALASGKMGLMAPVAAVVGAGIPTIVVGFSEGFPGYRHALGFVLAGIGVWLISRTEEGRDRPEGLGLAVIAGVGFAGFYLFIHQAGTGSALWLAVCSRSGSFLITSIFVLAGKHTRSVPLPVFGIALLAGCLEVTGSAAFIRANQTGRLDEAVVLSSLYPAITVLLARLFLHEHFSRGKTVGMLAALAAVPMIAG